MRRPQRLIAAAVLVALSGALAGCGSTAGFDPSDLLDFLDTKKKLPGERKPVFPDGVPGLEQGVPKDLYKGARQQQDQPPVAGVAPAPAPEPKSRRAAAKSDAQASAPSEAEPFPQAVDDPNAPKMKKPKRTRITAPPPDAESDQAQTQQAPPRQAPPPAQPQTSFPAPLPGGSFAR